MLGFRAWDQHSRRDQKIKPPELLMSGDVLRGAATGPLTNDLVITGLLVGSKFALRMGVKIGALTAKNEHDQQLGVQARRRNVILNEELVRGIDGLFELHVRENVSQSMRGRQKAFCNMGKRKETNRKGGPPSHLQKFSALG